MYAAKRSDFLFTRLHALRNLSLKMSDELVVFEVERLLLDRIQILDLQKSSEPATIDFLCDLVSTLASKRLGIPPLHALVENAGYDSYGDTLENTIRPAMYEICQRSNDTSLCFIYRCLNAASLLAEYGSYDVEFSVGVRRKARDIVGEWLHGQ